MYREMRVIDGGLSTEPKPTPTNDAMIPLFENRIYIEKDTNDVYKFDIKTFRWEQISYGLYGRYIDS
jgi:hypothetical protein